MPENPTNNEYNDLFWNALNEAWQAEFPAGERMISLTRIGMDLIRTARQAGGKVFRTEVYDDGNGVYGDIGRAFPGGVKIERNERGTVNGIAVRKDGVLDDILQWLLKEIDAERKKIQWIESIREGRNENADQVKSAGM